MRNDSYLPGDVIDLTSEEPAPLLPTPVDRIQEQLLHRDSAEGLLSNIEFHEGELSPRLQRLRNAGLLLFSFGTGFGNGVFKNIESRQAAKDNLVANLKNPIGRIKEGWSYDKDSFRTNFVEHPVIWFSYATYLKSKGASDKETLVVTQVANLLWEGAIEGTYVPPSGKDLVTDLVSSLAAIYLYNKGPGKALGDKITALEDWGAQHGIKLAPTFGKSVSPRGGARVGTSLFISIR